MWSPDGTRIAFESTRDGNLEIYVMQADGSHQKRLTFDPATDASPSWAPDGQHLLFFSNRTTTQNLEGHWQLYSIDLETLQTQLLPQPTGDAFRPVLSPDGSRVAFDAWTEKADTHQLFVMHSDGTNLHALTHTESYESAPQWSPDGTQLVFLSERDFERADEPRDTPAEIYRMNSDGSEQTRLTSLQARSHYPYWSPDGTHIAFETDVTGDLEIFVTKADGSDLQNVTRHPARDTSVSWSPQGDKMAFVSDRDGKADIYVMTWLSTETPEK
ncbi:MAG TPA: DPP IV N-terminal domain-containing protein [Rhodothermales bacterium]|nr:DPP IV N-terminal domain-containing protein [Rhodothermales bacterium]